MHYVLWAFYFCWSLQARDQKETLKWSTKEANEKRTKHKTLFNFSHSHSSHHEILALTIAPLTFLHYYAMHSTTMHYFIHSIYKNCISYRYKVLLKIVFSHSSHFFRFFIQLLLCTLSSAKSARLSFPFPSFLVHTMLVLHAHASAYISIGFTGAFHQQKRLLRSTLVKW